MPPKKLSRTEWFQIAARIRGWCVGLVNSILSPVPRKSFPQYLHSSLSDGENSDRSDCGERAKPKPLT